MLISLPFTLQFKVTQKYSLLKTINYRHMHIDKHTTYTKWYEIMINIFGYFHFIQIKIYLNR